MLEEIINRKETTIIDVRTPEEFSQNHVEGSINIPLQEIPNRVEEVKSFSQPLVLCCAAGVRSEYACQYLSQMDIECYNGGSWQEVNALVKK